MVYYWEDRIKHRPVHSQRLLVLLTPHIRGGFTVSLPAWARSVDGPKPISVGSSGEITLTAEHDYIKDR